MRLRYIAILFLMMFSLLLKAQEDHHDHGENEVAFIPGIVYDLSSREAAFSMHGHYLRNLRWWDERISAGINIELVTGNESHFTAGPVIAIKPIWKIICLYSPGITIIRENDTTDYHFSNHFEVALEFRLSDNMHFGPSAGVNFAGSDNHISIGLHTGLAF